jgi:hypothetical protein
VALLCSHDGIALPVPQAETSKTIEKYRLHMFDAPFRSLANRTIELMFDIRLSGGPTGGDGAQKLLPWRGIKAPLRAR